MTLWWKKPTPARSARADIIARQFVPAGEGLGMIAMQQTNKVLRHCAIGVVREKYPGAFSVDRP